MVLINKQPLNELMDINIYFLLFHYFYNCILIVFSCKERAVFLTVLHVNIGRKYIYLRQDIFIVFFFNIGLQHFVGDSHLESNLLVLYVLGLRYNNAMLSCFICPLTTQIDRCRIDVL